MPSKISFFQKYGLPGLLILFSPLCFGETLIRFKDGSQTKSEDLLAQGKALVYIEKSCPVCHQYIQHLSVCKESVKEALQIVSISTPAQTKEIAQKIPGELTLYIVKDQKVAKSAYATPTTRLAHSQKLGILTCDELERLFTLSGGM